MRVPQTPSFRLDGRRALVAGASSGIGFGCAAALAQAGAAVTMAARRPDVLAKAAEALRATEAAGMTVTSDGTAADPAEGSEADAVAPVATGDD